MTNLHTLSHRTGNIANGIATNTDHAFESGRLAALDAFDSLRSSSRQLRNSVLDARDATLRTVRHEPAKTVMVIAALGMLVIGFAVLLGRPRRHD